MNTTRATAILIRHAERSPYAPKRLIPSLWRLRAEPHEVQARRLSQLMLAMSGGYSTKPKRPAGP